MKLKKKYMALKNGKIKLNQKIQNIEQKITRDFQQYETIRSFGKCIYTGKINIGEAEMGQSNLKNIVDFHNKSRPKRMEGKDKTREVHMLFMKVEK